MTADDYRLRFGSPRDPGEVYDTIVDVRRWWLGDITGDTSSVGDVFTYRHEPEHRSTQRITEAIRGERVVWYVDDAELTFVPDAREWVGTEIVFELEPMASGTAVTFTHRGLVPAVACFEACSAAWAHFVGESLRRRVDR